MNTIAIDSNIYKGAESYAKLHNISVTAAIEKAISLFLQKVQPKQKLLETAEFNDALSYVTAMYIAHKYEYQDVKETLLAVSNFVDLLDLQGNTVIEMLSSDWKDYEDATQNATALRAEGDCIVTRNKKDLYGKRGGLKKQI